MSQYTETVHERPRSDGRNIDPAVGRLTGEASQQVVRREAAPAEGLAFHVYGSPALETRAQAEPTYYDLPVIKRSVWSADIPTYFYTGGVAGAAMVLGTAGMLTNREELKRLTGYTRWIATAGSLASAVLLTHDLGRPDRFLFMLRVFRPTSPMNLGTWILTGFGGLSGFASVTRYMPKLIRYLGDTAAVGAALLGLPLSGYTGVLLSNTVVPLWQAARRTLPVMFIGSAASSAAALLELLPLQEPEHDVVCRFAAIGKAAELAGMLAVENSTGRVPRAAWPLRSGFSGLLWNGAKVLGAVSLALTISSRGFKGRRLAAGVLGTMAALGLRFALHYGGKVSALDPRATFRQQRQGLGAFEVTGRSAICGPGGERAVITETVPTEVK